MHSTRGEINEKFRLMNLTRKNNTNLKISKHLFNNGCSSFHKNHLPSRYVQKR